MVVVMVVMVDLFWDFLFCYGFYYVGLVVERLWLVAVNFCGGSFNLF